MAYFKNSAPSPNHILITSDMSEWEFMTLFASKFSCKPTPIKRTNIQI